MPLSRGLLDPGTEPLSLMTSNDLISVIPFSSWLQSFPASESFQTSQFFASDGQNIGVSASASGLSMNIQDWFPLGWTGLISLKSKGLSRVFSNTTVQKHQFSSFQLSLWSNSHIHTGLLEKPQFWLYKTLSAMFLLLNIWSGFVIAFLPRQVSFNFMVAVNICSDFGVPGNKVCHCFHCFSPSICH